MIGFARSDRSLAANWWWSIDGLAVGAVLALALMGAFLSLGASIAGAERYGLDGFHFFQRQMLFSMLALAVALCVSLLTPQQALLLGFAVLAAGCAGLLWTLIAGHEVKGAARWISLGGFTVQPIEFVKPGFVIFSAWCFARAAAAKSASWALLPAGVLAIIVLALFQQPDYGQALLLMLAWGALLFMSGAPLWLMGGMAGAAITGIAGLYQFGSAHFASRIDRFLTGEGDTTQTDRALEAFASGGTFGRGLGAGEVKFHLPDPQSDFAFAVLGEEFGFFVCVLIAGAFAALIWRLLTRAGEARDPFLQLAPAGLAVLIGMQALVNMGVNLSLLPTKGLTLPFISYGGSSMIAVGLTAGLALALTRRRPASAAPAIRLETR